ncbi:MAG: hypothetical protein R2838_13205 [Caldilineaceae bacterium]
METEIPPRQHAADAATTLHARYERPFQMHASLGPSAAVAHFVDGTLTVWAQTQGVFPSARPSPTCSVWPRTRCT